MTDSDATRPAGDGGPHAGLDAAPHPATGVAADSTAGLAAAGAATAGAMLAAARARAGLSIDAVAQQLKLGVRQVQAIEEDNFAALPGRTFVRGFVRNYARLLKLDGDAVLAALPGSSAPALEAPSLHETAPSIGELPTTGGNRPGWTRWAIPLTLLAIIAGAAAYEFLRPTGDARHAGTKDTAAVATHAEPAKPAAESGVVALPNPIPPGGGSTGDVGNGAPSHPSGAEAPAAVPDAAVRGGVPGAPGAAAPTSPAASPAPPAIRSVPAPATTTTTATPAPTTATTAASTAAAGDVDAGAHVQGLVVDRDPRSDGTGAAVPDERGRPDPDRRRPASVRVDDRQRDRRDAALQRQAGRPRSAHAAERRPLHAALSRYR